MDVRIVSISSFVLWIVVTIGVKSSNLETSSDPRSLVPTLPTNPHEKISKIDGISEDRDVEGAPFDEASPSSDHEDPEKPSRPKFPRGIELDFVPTKLYAQVRKTETVKRLPREEAVKSAINEEEILAAPRLRKVVSKSKKNTIYTEEGYEDAAYDHAGHIRDADFHEDYARKLEDEENIKVDVAKRPEREDEEEKISVDRGDKYKNEPDRSDKFETIKNPWRDSSMDPKKIAENEIEKLEEDLRAEYAESEKNTETEIPLNLRNLGEENTEEDEESSSEADAAEHQRYGKKIDEESFEPGELSRKLSNNFSSIEPETNEVEEISSSRPMKIYHVPTSVNKSADYGKIFWDYFKELKKSREFSTPKAIDATQEKTEKSLSEGFTIVPSVETTLAATDPSVNSPSTEFNDFFHASEMDYPSASSSYESWKRQDHHENSEESDENDFPSLAFRESKSDEMKNSQDDDEDPSLNLENVGGTTTLIGPKKLSYTVIIRPSEKPTTRNPPCDRQVHTRKGEKASGARSSLRNLARPDGIQTELNDYSLANDFTGIQPPLPPAQVTYTDFMPDSYGSLAARRPSATREIDPNGQEETINNIERDRYESMKNSYVNHGPKPRPRYHRFRHQKKKLHHFLPSTRLVPPAPINRSKYSDYLGVKRIGKPIEKTAASLNYDPWPGIMRFYRSFERKIFGRRRRSLDDEINKEGNLSRSDSGKMRKNKLRLERNWFRESDGSVGADNASPVKSIVSGVRKRRNDERLLHKAPSIVDEIINDEIESRFKEEDVISDDKDHEEYDEEREKLEIEVPDFDFSEVVDDNGNEDVATKRPTKQSSPDIEKYPFYENPKVPRYSPLKYITNPLNVPKKTLGGTEFYDSRDRYRKCGEVDPDLDGVLPEEEEPSGTVESRSDKRRLSGLGDALECFRAKYFDDDPLDNPLFLEERVGQPRIPEELEPAKLRIGAFAEPIEDEDRVVARLSRKPEKHRSTRQGNVGVNVRKIRQRGIKHEQTMRTSPELAARPYQRQVYEDVMGTIKNLAGLYETFGEPAVLPRDVHRVYDNPHSDVKEKNVDSEAVHITERPRGSTIGRSSPREPTKSPKSHRYRIIPYRTNRVTYGKRKRNESPPGENGIRAGYFRTVTVHKRSVKDDERSSDLNAAETRHIDKSSMNNGKKSAVPAASERIVYTIRDRIRHSKPREFFAKHGKFTNLEASASEDVRRREPRYSTAGRKKLPRDKVITTAPPPEELEDDAKEERNLPAGSRMEDTASGGYDFHDEPGETYKIQYSTTHGKQVEPDDLREDYREDQESDVHAGKTQKQRNNYDVREDPQDDIATLANVMESTEGPKFFELRKYLESDPPGYSKAFHEESMESSRYSEDEEPQKSLAETKREESDERVEEEGIEEEEKQVERPLDFDGVSSSRSIENDDSSGQAESYKKAKVNREDEESKDEEEEKDEETHSPQMDDEPFHVEDAEKEFERFASRPFSPFESYEDPKYADLGPRLSKPSFRHPSFSDVKDRRTKHSRGWGDDDESNERDGEKSSYVFPWDADKSNEEDDKDSNEKSGRIERHEYPWERRERLARERRKRAKEREERERLYGFFQDEEDEEDASSSNSRLSGKFIYPWERYRASEGNRRYNDNEETSSNYRPRFSSRYKTRKFNMGNDDDDAAASSGGDPQGAKKPRLKSMKKASNATLAPQKSRGGNSRAETTSATPSPIVSSRSNRKLRVWRIATTTKKPVASEETLESESRKEEVVANPVRRNRLNSSLMNSSGNLTAGRTFRRRGSLIDRSTTSIPISTEKSPRQRFHKTTMKPERKGPGDEESTVKSLGEKNTTPEVKTVEHRSRFSKEEIITKTSYPAFGDNDNNHDNDEKMEGEDSSELREKFLNESVKKVSITTKETPEHIYRTEEIDKNGVKGMFVSIIPNNGTNSSINTDETMMMLEEFDDEESSFTNDRNVLAGLLMQAPPRTNPPMLDKSIEKDDIFGAEESRSFEDETVQEDSGTTTRYVKKPDERLYYYVEDS